MSFTEESTTVEEYHPSLRHSSSTDDRMEEVEVDESVLYHQRIQRAQHSFQQLQNATLACATNTHNNATYTPARLEELRRFILEEMDAGNEHLAYIHFCALIYMVPPLLLPPWSTADDPMSRYLAEQHALNVEFFHHAMVPLTTIRHRLEAHFHHCLTLNRLVCHEWTHKSAFVAPIQQNASTTIELPNPAYQQIPTNPLSLLHVPKRRKLEAQTIEEVVVRGATNEDFRVVQLAYFYEFRQMITFYEALESAVIERHVCGGHQAEVAINNVGWMASLFRNPNASRIIIPMQENIHKLFVYPGNARHMQLSLNYDLNLVSALVVASTIQSPTYAMVAKQLVGNIPLLWNEMAVVPRSGEKETQLAWDVRAGVLLFHFYLLHIIYVEKPAEEQVLPISIYTLKRGPPEKLTFRLASYKNCLLLFRRRTYLCRPEGVVCYEGYHAVEHGLRAWVQMIHGPSSQIAEIMNLLHVPLPPVTPAVRAVPVAEMLPTPQVGLSAETTQIPNSAYASNLPCGSIFSSNGT